MTTPSTSPGTPPFRSRRQFLTRLSAAAGGALIAPSLLAACGKGDDSSSGSTGSDNSPKNVDADWPDIKSRQVVLAGFGGETYKIRDRDAFRPYTKLSGAKVVQATWDYGKFVKMVPSEKPQWDMMDVDGYTVAALVQQGKAPAQLADWVRRCDLVDPIYRDYAAGSYAYSVVLGWSTKLKNTPRTWKDFFDTKKFPGKRAFPKSIYAGTIEIALLAAGVSPDKMYPLDIDRGLEELDKIKKDLIFYDSYAQGQQYMTQGSASMIATANSRMIQLKDDGQPVDWTYEQGVLYPWGAFAMTQNAPNADAANALIDFMSTPEAQANVGKKLFLGPIVSEAFDHMTKQQQALQPSYEDNVKKQLLVDADAAGEQDNEYVEKFFKWVGE